MPVTVDDVKAAIADTLHKAGGAADLPASWNGIAARALGLAQKDMYRILGSAGYSVEQADAWRALEREPWLTMQALYWSLVLGDMVNGEEEAKDFSALDQRETLLSVTLYDEAGEFIIPTGYATMVGHGDSKARSEFVDPATGLFRPY
jgi:hypothetical protein